MITGLILKRPDSKRRTFQVIPYQRVGGKKVYQSPVEDKALEAINESLKAGILKPYEAELEIKSRVLPELKRKLSVRDKVITDVIISENNVKVYKNFWKEYYRRMRLERPQTTKDEFLAALRLLEPLSLHSCDVDTLQDHWDAKVPNGTRHKRYGNRINQLLNHLSRGIEIQTNRAIIPPLKWVTWEELEQILEFIPDTNQKDLYRTLYGTGCREGEAFAFDSETVRVNGTAYIHKQMDRQGVIKPYTKNKKAHDTVILEEAIEAAKRWSIVEDKIRYRKCSSHPLREAALRAFPAQKTKQISPHKLRHSYVKKMLTLGVPLEKVAQYLGDRTSTVENIYRQWVVSDLEIDFIRDIMRAGYARLKK